MKQVTLPAFLVYGLLIAILVIVGIFFFAMKDGNDCLANPFVYGAVKATDEDTGRVSCSCEFGNPDYVTLYFDVDGMSAKNPLFDLLE